MGGGVSKEKIREEKFQLLKQTPFFTMFEGDDGVKECADYFRLEKIKEGEHLNDGAFIVVAEGELALSTLVPKSALNPDTKAKKGHVSELLAIKKTGDFFSKVGRELATSHGTLKSKKPKYFGSVDKVVNAFDFTTVRAMRDSTILVLDGAAKVQYLEKHAAHAHVLEKVLSTDIRQMLKPIPFLKGMNKARLTSLSEMFTYETHVEGDMVLQEGALDDSFYLVLHGKLEVTATIEPQVFQERSVSRLVAVPSDPVLLDSPGSSSSKIQQVSQTIDEENEEEELNPEEVEKVVERVSKVELREGSFGNKVPVLQPQPSIRLLRKSSTLVNEDIKTLFLATLEGGTYFGEMGMMIKIPRTATVTAVEKCLLAKMRGEDFAKFLKLSPEVQKALDQDAKERMVRKLYAFRLPFFAGIPKDKLLELANLCELKQFDSGSVLLEEGGSCGTFYIVLHGLVNVVKNGKAIIRLAQGAYFGEISMLTGKPHLATVTAHSDVVLLAVTTVAFNEFFKESKQLLAEFQMRVLGEKEITLTHILMHSLGRELFRQHLENEFTVEHLFFWEAVDAYHNGKQTYEYICSNYIGPSSKTPINVSASMSQAVLDGQKTMTSFDECQREIYNLMKRDNFGRFRKTPLYQELMESLNVYSNEDIIIDQADLRRAEMSFGKVVPTSSNSV